MSKVLNKILFIALLFSSFQLSIHAIDCEYEEAGLTITYDENGASINSDFIDKEYYKSNLLFGTGEAMKATPELDIDQSLWEKYKGGACPSGMNVCEITDYSVNLPTLKSLGAAILNLFFNSIVVSPFVSDDLKDVVGEEAYELITFNAKSLYVLTDLELKKKSFSELDDGITIYNTATENYDDARSFCMDGNEGLGWEFLGFACGFLGGKILNIWDTIVGDFELIGLKDKHCSVVYYDGPYASFNVNCGLLFDKQIKYFDKIESYKKCGEDSNCKIGIKKDLNELEDKIKSQCSSILQNHNYKDGQKECIDNCLKIRDTLNGYKKGTDLYIDYSNTDGDCNVSGRLLAWISNILKWIKYILPAIVVVLGIIDFIKALASDKDDEMKKAQGRFVKRLIAAALVFIIPFILEFVLEKMGFGYDSCSLF